LNNDENKKVGISAAVITFGIIGVMAIENFITPVYSETVRSESPWEGSTVPACESESVSFSGILKFTIQIHEDKDGTTLQKIDLKSHAAHGIGVESGTDYILHTSAKQTTESRGDGTTITNVLKGSFIGKGSTVNTQVTIHTVTVFDENGNADTTESDIDIKCNG